MDIFKRVYDEIHPKIAAKRKRQEAGEPEAIRTTYVTPKKENRGLLLREKILKALAAGPLDSTPLAVACGTDWQNRSFNRARRQLIVEGKIVSAGQNGRSHQYALAPPTAKADEAAARLEA